MVETTAGRLQYLLFDVSEMLGEEFKIEDHKYNRSGPKQRVG